MSAAVPLSKVRLLNRLRCQIFQTSYNPTSVRTGAKYLRERLHGPALVKYYPENDGLSIAKLNKKYPGWNLVDVDEVVRLNDIEELKARGKGAPKKARSKDSLSLLCCKATKLIRITPTADSRRSARKR